MAVCSGENLIRKTLSALMLVSCLIIAGFNNQARAQDIYANVVTDSSSDFQNSYRVADGNLTNYAYVSNLLSLLNTSYLKVRFPKSGKAGDVINVSVQGTGQILGASLLSNVTFRFYDSMGNNVHNSTNSSVLELALLSSIDSVYGIRYITNPADTFKFKEVRVEFNNLLNVNVLNQFRVYNIYYQEPCPPNYADSVFAFGTNSLLTGFVTNPGRAVDGNTSTYATLNNPLNILSLLPPAYLDLRFSKAAIAGSYVGFTVSQNTSLLSLALLDDVTVYLYDESGTLRETKNNFTTLDLELLSGTGNIYSIGFVSQTGNYRISRIRVVLNPVLGLLQNLNVHNAFHYKIDRPPVPVSSNRSTVLCPGDNVTLTAASVPGSSGYLWSNNATTQSITVSYAQAGTYYVTVLDSFSCSRRSIDIEVKAAQPPTPKIIGDTILCTGIREGVLRIGQSYAGGYAWSNNTTADTLVYNNSGNYYVTVTDSNGCVGSDTVDVNDNNISINQAILNSDCSNNNTGSISLNISGGSGNFSYRWSDGSTQNSLSNLLPGLYTTTITDNGQGCVYNRAYTIASENTLTVKASVNNTSTCGASDGDVAIDVVGGSGTYTYTWSNSATTKNLTNVKAGIYTVNITDQVEGCQTTYTVAVSDGKSNLVLTPSVTANKSCNSPDGAVSVNVTGGSGTYTYLWSTSATTSSISNLNSGDYYLLVTDDIQNCSKAIMVSIPDSATPIISGNVTASNCNKGTGAITLSIANGSGNYSYNWSNGVTASSLSNVMSGTYFVTVFDNTTGCSAQKVFSIGEVSAPTATLAITDPLCNSNANGSITISTTGSYKYLWSNGATTKDITNLNAGKYSVQITDSVSGCSLDLNTELTTRGQMLLTSSVTTNTACAAFANGAIDVDITSGTNPYTYSWSNSDTTEDLQNVGTGSYTLNVTDDNGCTGMISSNVKTDSSKLINITVDNVVRASCSTATNASVDVTVKGGIGSYSYSWTSGDTTEDIMNVMAGNYIITVTDSIGCQESESVSIGVDTSKLVQVNIDSITSAGCTGSTTGAVYISPMNGVAPYTYSWSNGTSNQDLTNVGTGSYSVTMTDNVGCKTTASAVVDSTVFYTDGSVTNTNCYGSSDGEATVQVFDGSGSYTYNWSTGATTATISNLSTGSYIVTVKDEITKCQIMDTFTVDQPDSISATASVTKDDCSQMNTGQILLTVSGGTTPYTYEWSNGSTASINSGLAAGAYSVMITDANNCNSSISAEVTREDCDFNLVIPDVITPNGDGANDTWIITGIQFYPNSVLQVYDKWGDMVYEKRNYSGGWSGTKTDGSNLADGTYYYLLKLNEQNKTGGKDAFTGFLMIQR